MAPKVGNFSVTAKKKGKGFAGKCKNISLLWQKSKFFFLLFLSRLRNFSYLCRQIHTINRL
jgi:hypothetical protein